MLNRYFRVDGNNSMDFMYANIAVKNTEATDSSGFGGRGRNDI